MIKQLKKLKIEYNKIYLQLQKLKQNIIYKRGIKLDTKKSVSKDCKERPQRKTFHHLLLKLQQSIGLMLIFLTRLVYLNPMVSMLHLNQQNKELICVILKNLNPKKQKFEIDLYKNILNKKLIFYNIFMFVKIIILK